MKVSRLYRDTDVAFMYPVGYFEVLMTDLQHRCEVVINIAVAEVTADWYM